MSQKKQEHGEHGHPQRLAAPVAEANIQTLRINIESKKLYAEKLLRENNVEEATHVLGELSKEKQALADIEAGTLHSGHKWQYQKTQEAKTETRSAEKAMTSDLCTALVQKEVAELQKLHDKAVSNRDYKVAESIMEKIQFF